MKKNKKIIFNLIFFILLITLTFYILLKDQNILDIFNLMLNSNKTFILIAVFCMFIYLLLEGVNMLRTIRISGNKGIKLASSLKYSFIGFFFSAITPAASGGQPMQIYYMHRDKISAADSTLALLMNLCCFQIVTISMALISLIFNAQYLQGGMIALFIVGIVLNSSALALLIIGIFSRRLSKWLVNLAIKILKKFKIRNAESKIEKLNSELDKYHSTSKYIKQHRKLMVKMVLTTLVQIMVYYSIPYWIYKALGFSGENIIKMIGLQAILYATVSGIPLPGAVGVSESGFMNIFKSIFTEETISGAMLINRGVSFYLFVIISGIVVIINLFKTKKEDKIKVIDESKEEV
ncbi:MAG: flippase-like domain-containing protein [Clostridia bacterium]|nr:flippase-like domain-containing protein [Clostridia bacterium]